MNSRSFLYSAAVIFAALAIIASRTALGTVARVSAAPAMAGAALSVLPATTTPDVFPVVKVVDGDTLDVLMDDKPTRIRIIGMDTPEIVDPRKPVQCFAREASAEGHRILEHQYVRLEFGPANDARDKYGRVLAYVFLMDGTSYEGYMIANGFAHEYTYNKQKYTYQSDFKALQQQAQTAKKGFWADDTCAGNTTKPAVS